MKDGILNLKTASMDGENSLHPVRRVVKDRAKQAIKMSEELRDNIKSIRQSKTIEKSIQSFRGIEVTEQMFNLVKQKIKDRKMNTQNILNSKSSQRKESSSRETRIRISFKNHQEGLPTIKRVEPTKPIDVDSEDI